MLHNIDLIDRKILYQLDLDARIPTTVLAKTLRIGRETANYRINNLVKRGIIRKFVTMSNPAKFGYSVYKMYIKFQNINKEKEKEILSWLSNNEFIYWIADCQGKWDLNFSVFARTINHFEEIMSEFFEKYGEFISEQEFNTTLKVGIMNKGWIVPEIKETKKVIYFGGEYQDIGLDSVDLELLKILANNGRLSANDLAHKINSTARIVLYRMKELDKKGVILGYSTSLDLDILNKQFFKAMLYFKIFNKSIKNKIIEYCRNNKNIGFFIFCVGSWPVEIEIIVDNNKQFYEVMDHFQETFPEMRGYDFIIFPKEHKFDWVPQCYRAAI